MIRAVIFDMDGLMIDSEPLAIQAWQTTVGRLGRVIGETVLTRMFGLREIECAAMLQAELSLPVTVQALLHQRNEIFLNSLPGRLKAMPGLRELLAELQARRLRCAIATSGERHYVTVVMRELSLDGVFETIVVAEDVTRGKPAPQVYLLAARRLGLPPADCLVLEDAPNGVIAAKAAGMTCVAVPNEFTRQLDLSAADTVLPSLLAVRDNLDGLIR